MNINPILVPFSAPRSYLALGVHKKDDWWCEHPAGLFLRELRTSRDEALVAHLVPLGPDGAPLAVERYESHPESFRAECAAGAWEFVFADPATILARADRPGLGLRLDFLAEGRRFHMLFAVPAPGAAAARPGRELAQERVEVGVGCAVGVARCFAVVGHGNAAVFERLLLYQIARRRTRSRRT